MKKKVTKFDATWTEIGNMVDVVFDPVPDSFPWIVMCAGPVGRGLICALFPQGPY